MTYAKLVNEILKRETGKKEVNVAQVKTILRHLADMWIDDPKPVKDAWASYIVARSLSRKDEERNM